MTLGRRDLGWLAVLAACAAVLLAPVLLTGRTWFLNDLIYYYHAWRVQPAEQLQRGLLPLWNPYAYMGMPLHGAIQAGVFAPATLPFHLFGFPTALRWHWVLHHALAGFFAYLWLSRFGRAAGLAGGALFTLGGFFASHPTVLGWTVELAWWPAFFLLASRPVALGLAMACALLAGFPTVWAGMWAASLAVVLLWRPRRWKEWAAATAFALALSAVVLAPGAELAARSHRRALDPQDRVVAYVRPAEVTGFLHPGLVDEEPTTGLRYPLWKTFQVGFAAAALAALGLARAGARGGALLLLAAASVFAATGPATALGKALWEHVPPFSLLRGPAHLVYLPLAAVVPLAALALRGRRWARWAALAVCLELTAVGFGSQDTVPDRFWTDAGPLVRRLQAELDGHRYFATPQTARMQAGLGATQEDQYFDLKHRLYSVENVPYRLPAVASLGESMMHLGAWRVMDFLYSRRSAGEALAYLPWVDGSQMLSRHPLPGSTETLWHVVRVPGAARARWLPAHARLDVPFEQAPASRGEPLAYREPREDRATVSGMSPGPGWIFLANPEFPGWRAWLDGKPVEPKTALTAFMRFATPPGPFRLELRYLPASFAIGAWLSLGVLAAAAAYGWRRLRA